MKKHIFYLTISSILLFACKNQYDISADYDEPNGSSLPGKAVAAIYRSGVEKCEIVWHRGTDPSVTYARIYWNNYTDSVQVDIPADADTVRYRFESIAEGDYSFVIKQFNKSGLGSVPVELMGKVYGDIYLASLRSRIVSNMYVYAPTGVIASLGDVPNGCKSSEIVYTNASGEEISLRVSPETKSVALNNWRQNVKIRSFLVLPEITSDTLTTNYIAFSYTLPLAIDKSSWTIVEFSSQWNDSEGLRAGNAIDGNYNNRWHSSSSNFPHFMVVDMGGSVPVTKFGAMPASVDMGNDPNRFPYEIIWSVSNDGQTWTSLGTFTTAPYQAGVEQYFEVAPTTARYFRFAETDKGTPDPSKLMVIGELDAFAY